MNEARRPLPQSVPLVRGLAELYAPAALGAQRNRWARLAAALDPASSGPRRPTLYFSAPGRTELLGNHTDHNRGRVLAAGIDLDAAAAVRPRQDRKARIDSEGFGAFELDLDDLEPKAGEHNGSTALVRGLAAALADGRFAPPGSVRGRELLKGFDARLSSSVPPGSGLSSSAAFEVLLGAIVSHISGFDASPLELARAGQYAENEYFGKPSGLMDQTASALGSVVAIDFGEAEGPGAETLSFDPRDYGLSLVIVATGGSHADLTADYASIPAEMRSVAAEFGRTALAGIGKAELLSRAAALRASCGDRAFLRAWHFAGETERTIAAAGAIVRKDIGAFLSAVRASGDSSWRYLQNLQSGLNPSEQGLGVALALTEDFLRGEGASRVHGGGFAGTIQAYIPADRLDGYRSLMEPIFGPGSVVELAIRPCGVVRIENIV